MRHISVLLHTSIDALEIKAGDIFVDGTLGNGGHTEEVFKRFGHTVTMIGIDLDSDAIARTIARLPQDSSVKYIQGSFRNIDTILDSLDIAEVQRILLDIGLSSNQFEESGRGFSFQKDEPLSMSFQNVPATDESVLTAHEIVNSWDGENIRAILEGYGEEKFAYKIAQAIVRERAIRPITTTTELVDIILGATPSFYHHRKIHPATKTFQALRITVNDEIESLKDGLEKGFARLASGGRMAVISFHSLEDRVVKQFYKQKKEEGQGVLVSKKPITPDDEEIASNPRSRSAKLRVIEKI